MHTRRELERRLGVCVLSGLLGIAACEGKPASSDSETIGETTAALTVAKPLARGLVRDGAGKPIARARVDVRAAGSTRIIACVSTASDGTFPLNVRAGTYDLTVTARTGFAPQVFPGQAIARGSQLELIIVTAGGPTVATVSGHVTDQNGQPLGVVVCAPDCVDTDDSGAFTLTARTDLSLEISGGLSPAGFFNASASFDPTSSAPLEIVIPIFNLDGTLLDPGGAPMANTGVTSPPCSSVVSDQIGGTFCVNGTQTDANGRFHFTALPGDVALQVFGDAGIFTTVSVAGDTDVNLKIPPVHSFGGRITDRDGNGLPGNTLCLTHDGCVSHYCSRSCLQTGADGGYQFNLSEGTYDVELTSSGTTSPIGFYTLSQTLTLTEATVLDLPFANRIVTGTVLNLDGTPAPNVPVKESCHDIDVVGFVGLACAAATTTDATGRFQMTLPGPGDVVLTASGAVAASVHVTVGDDTDVAIPLSIAQSVTGAILNADGSPAVDYSVCYEPAGLFTGLTCTNTDANGFYQLTLSPGPYSLSIFGFTPGASEVSIGQSVTVPSAPTLIQLAPTQPVAVRIVNTDGTPLAGAQLFSLCGTAPAVIGGTERFCAEPPASDAAGAVTVLTPIGSPLQLQIESSSISAPLAIDAVPVGDHTEVTIAVQSAASP